MRSVSIRRLVAGASVAAAALAMTTALAHASSPTARSSTFTAEVWADNWFALYVNGKKVGEDSVPITTERSFNSERLTFTATYPLTIGLVGKDYMQDASGLEYIGTSRQQVGDGGIIAQITDNKTGAIIAVTSSNWRTLVLQAAPLNPACVTSVNPIADCTSSTTPEPAGWSTTWYSVRSWPRATVYTPEEVGVKDGYNTVRWAATAKLIWGSDLKRDNVILFRTTVR